MSTDQGTKRRSATANDLEMRAISQILRVLDPLDTTQQKRVLDYVGDRLSTEVTFDVHQLAISCSEAFRAINEAAMILNQGVESGVTTPQLVAAVLSIYQKALDNQQPA